MKKTMVRYKRNDPGFQCRGCFKIVKWVNDDVRCEAYIAKKKAKKNALTP